MLAAGRAREAEFYAGRVAEFQRGAEFIGTLLAPRRELGEDTEQAAAIPEQKQQAADPLQPVEAQDHSPAETQTGKAHRAAEFLKAERAERETNKAALQELGRAHGVEITGEQGDEITQTMGGGISF